MDGINLQASCNCGRLVIQMSGPPNFAYICHCLSCRKDSGSLFTAQLKYPIEAVTWVRGTDAVKRWYGRPVQGDEVDATGAVARRDDKGNILASNGFCSVCGAQVLCEMDDGIVVRLGAIDVEDDPAAAELVNAIMPGENVDASRSAFWPKYEFYCMRKVSWAKEWNVQGAKQSEKLPGQ